MTSGHECCDACGFDGAIFSDADLLVALRALPDRWRQLLAVAGDHLRSRPEPSTWSGIEYAAHTRDVTQLHAYGVKEALSRDEPMFPPIGDELADAATSTYGEADPIAVAEAFENAVQRLTGVAEDAGFAAWSRRITVGETRSDVRRLLEHALHDSRHHLRDVEHGLARLSMS